MAWAADPILSWLLILLAAFFAGALNAVAGGGSFLTLPALLLIGVPAVTANATGTLALLPGYLASCFGYRRELRLVGDTQPLLPMVLLALFGGAIGAALLLLTSDTLFRQLLPWLLLAATLLFVFAPQLLGEHGAVKNHWLKLGVFLVAIYGGYFNGGLGILLMALFALTSSMAIQPANGVKNLLSALLTLIAVVLYFWGGVIEWQLGLPMMLTATLGGYVGAEWGRLLPASVLRGIIIFTGSAMTLLFFIY
jgi:hypothetical protein